MTFGWSSSLTVQTQCENTGTHSATTFWSELSNRHCNNKTRNSNAETYFSIKDDYFSLISDRSCHEFLQMNGLNPLLIHTTINFPSLSV